MKKEYIVIVTLIIFIFTIISFGSQFNGNHIEKLNNPYTVASEFATAYLSHDYKKAANLCEDKLKARFLKGYKEQGKNIRNLDEMGTDNFPKVSSISLFDYAAVATVYWKDPFWGYVHLTMYLEPKGYHTYLPPIKSNEKFTDIMVSSENDEKWEIVKYNDWGYTPSYQIYSQLSKSEQEEFMSKHIKEIEEELKEELDKLSKEGYSKFSLILKEWTKQESQRQFDDINIKVTTLKSIGINF